MITALIGLMTSRNNMYQAQASTIRNNNTIMGLAFGANRSNVDSFCRMENNLVLENQMNYVNYMINQQLTKSYEKLLRQRIKETFSIFNYTQDKTI